MPGAKGNWIMHLINTSGKILRGAWKSDDLGKCPNSLSWEKRLHSLNYSKKKKCLASTRLGISFIKPLPFYFIDSKRIKESNLMELSWVKQKAAFNCCHVSWLISLVVSSLPPLCEPLWMYKTYWQFFIDLLKVDLSSLTLSYLCQLTTEKNSASKQCE